MVAISSYFTIARAAEILDEDEEWIHELSIDMFAEDGCVTIYGVGQESITAFSDFGIENLRETILEARPSGDAPSKGQSKPST
jgi:hypothetical protein